jgi:hypothetical protein
MDNEWDRLPGGNGQQQQPIPEASEELVARTVSLDEMRVARRERYMEMNATWHPPPTAPNNKNTNSNSNNNNNNNDNDAGSDMFEFDSDDAVRERPDTTRGVPPHALRDALARVPGPFRAPSNNPGNQEQYIRKLTAFVGTPRSASSRSSAKSSAAPTPRRSTSRSYVSEDEGDDEDDSSSSSSSSEIPRRTHAKRGAADITPAAAAANSDRGAPGIYGEDYAGLVLGDAVDRDDNNDNNNNNVVQRHRGAAAIPRRPMVGMELVEQMGDARRHREAYNAIVVLENDCLVCRCKSDYEFEAMRPHVAKCLKYYMSKALTSSPQNVCVTLARYWQRVAAADNKTGLEILPGDFMRHFEECETHPLVTLIKSLRYWAGVKSYIKDHSYMQEPGRPEPTVDNAALAEIRKIEAHEAFLTKQAMLHGVAL